MADQSSIVTVQLSLVPQGGTDANRVNIPAHLVFFGTAKADTANNVLRIGDKSYKLDSLQFVATPVAQTLPSTPQGNGNNQNTNPPTA